MENDTGKDPCVAGIGGDTITSGGDGVTVGGVKETVVVGGDAVAIGADTVPDREMDLGDRGGGGEGVAIGDCGVTVAAGGGGDTGFDCRVDPVDRGRRVLKGSSSSALLMV